MSEQDTGLMEKQMLSADVDQEENGKKTATNNKKFHFKKHISVKEIWQKVKNISQVLIKPKALVIYLFIIVSAIVFFAFKAISSKDENYLPKMIEVGITVSPSPQSKENRELRKQVEKFNRGLGLLDTDSKDLAFPKVDTEIRFDK